MKNQKYLEARESARPKDLHFRQECGDYTCGAHKSWNEGFDQGAAYTLQREEIVGLVDALRRLCNEVDALNIAELEIRRAIGNTNWEVLKHWKQNGLTALEKFNQKKEEWK